MQILAIEDNPETARYIASGLTEAGHQVYLADDGPSGLLALRRGKFDLMIVDRLLPGLDGLSVVQLIRDQGMTLPVLFLSALDGVDDRVKGLNAGGDDYLVKPFSLRELQARVAALGRRYSMSAQEILLKAGDLEMNLVSRRVTRGDTEIELLPREWELLEYLMINKGRLVTRKMLLEKIWDFHFDPRTNVVETHISRLRQKIDKGFDSELIQTVRGSGYLLRDPT
ncbi:MAG TPA: response regulator transcription factor [Magnetospirillaceae bacterium]|nr:response regulator transcription factor [Magnetospirillaceae bacterium]